MQIGIRIKYLWTRYRYNPSYDLDDFARINDLEYEPRQLVKIMKALYEIRLEDNYLY